MTTVRPRVATPAGRLHSLRWWALGVIAASQLMVVLSASVINIALPQVQQALTISDADRQWLVTAYTLGVGGLLLLGGRIADNFGRKRILIIGLIGFGVASCIGGLAGSAPVLFAARGLQGAFAAGVMPAALSLLTVTFTDRHERAIAFSIYGAMTGAGGAVGLVLGGVLTESASWRWCLLVNVPVAALVAALAGRWITESRPAGHTHYDVPGAAAVTLGLTALVYALSTAGAAGWNSTRTIILLAAGGVLLATFVAVEARSRQPLLPLHIALDRNRGGALLVMLLAAASLFTMFLFLTYYLQGTLHYSAVQAGLAFLPASAGTIVGTLITARLLTRTAPRNLLVAGMLLTALGLLWFTRLGVSTSYWLHVLPGELAVGVGMGLVFVTVASTALVGVAASDSGVASALVGTSQQVGASLGTALLNTVAATATAGYAATQVDAAAGLVHGYQVAFLVSAIMLGVGAIGSALLVNAKQDELTRT